MASMRHVLDPDHGPVVQVTIGLSFEQEERRVRREGDAGLARRSVRAPINLGLPMTLISRSFCQELDPYQRDLKYQTRRHNIPLLLLGADPEMLGEKLRPQITASVMLEELQPALLFREVEVVIVETLEPFQCILGRNYLNRAALTLLYHGPLETFEISTKDG